MVGSGKPVLDSHDHFQLLVQLIFEFSSLIRGQFPLNSHSHEYLYIKKVDRFKGVIQYQLVQTYLEQCKSNSSCMFLWNYFKTFGAII